MTNLVTDKCPCCGTRGLNPKKIKDMCENCLETCFDQWRHKVAELEKENAELKKDKEYLDKTNNEQTEVILQLQQQIEKMKCCGNCKHHEIHTTKGGVKYCLTCRQLDENKEKIIYPKWEMYE